MPLGEGKAEEVRRQTQRFALSRQPDYDTDIAGSNLTLNVSSASGPDSWREREKEDVKPQ